MTRVWGGDVCSGCWWEKVRERDHWGETDGDGRIILRRIFRKSDVGLWIRLSWLRIETYGGHL
jgi:hypothetical protein